MNSKYTKLSAIVAVVFAICAPVNAQDASEKAGLVTVLDVAKIFEQNPAFKQQMEAIKSEADTLKAQIQADQEKIRQAAMELQNYEAGTQDRNSKEAALEQQQAAVRTTARQSEQELLNREALIYFETYKMMQDVVTSIAQENGISLVLRYDSAEIDKLNRAEVIKGVKRTIVYHRQLDLTTMVSKAMNTRTASAGGAMQK